jgi:toxin-antitoxin system PIN domain toxin
VIALDANVLVYAHRRDSEFHAAAFARVRDLAEGRDWWAIPWPCIHEFVAITTHPRIYAPPTSPAEAVAQVDAWLESPTLVVLGEAREHWAIMGSVVRDGHVVGPAVHDARVAAICIAHGVDELWTLDRDFGRFPRLRTRNPLQ